MSLPLAPALAAAAFVAACAPLPPPGASSGVRMLALSPQRAEIDAGGRRVVIAPPEGSCLLEDAAQASPGAAFLVISGCDGAPPEPAALQTISVGGSELFGAGEPSRDLAALERYLRSDEGRRELGMGGAPKDVRVVEMRRAGDALFVLVEDRGEDRLPLGNPRFWRVFSEINGRIAVLSLASLRTDDAETDEMLRRAQDVVAALDAANDEAGPLLGFRRPLEAPRPSPRAAS